MHDRLSVHSVTFLGASVAEQQSHWRALGLTRREARYVLNCQGTTIGLVGLLVGIPIGVLIGRWGWSYIAAQVPLDNVAPSAWLAVAVVVPGALLVVNALALWPGRRVANLRPAEILRSE